MTSEAAAAGDTAIPASLPVIVAVFVSVAVIDWLPAVSRVAEKVAFPEVRVALAGRTALGSLLANCTVPAYPVATLPYGSYAVTVTFPAAPAVSAVGKPVTSSVEAAAGLTAMPVSLPVIEEEAVSVAVIDCAPAVSRVTVKVYWPSPAAVKVKLAGRTALGSLLVKWTVPV